MPVPPAAADIHGTRQRISPIYSFSFLLKQKNFNGKPDGSLPFNIVFSNGTIFLLIQKNVLFFSVRYPFDPFHVDWIL